MIMFLLSAALVCTSFQCSALTRDEKDFVHSFVGHYETNITGKFTHEYHPYLLSKTAGSLGELEDRLTAEGLHPSGRILLMGYEEQGVPRYTTDFKDAYFSDEMAHKTSSGWSLQMFNRFGLLTGFLCKDLNILSEVAKKETGSALPMTHIDSDQIEIFDGKGTLFQEHAFGEAYNLVMNMHSRMQRKLARVALPEMCQLFISFWKRLYCGGLRITGKEHVVGTQDILFSINYMEHLKRSALPVSHFFIGPDITYPIEVNDMQSALVTRHAQSFVRQFVPHLTPRDGKKTAYVFCSFVDGVGKSTMLGNIQNWIAHGRNLSAYEHVDNSSSQLATIFPYNKDVVIADLPAQVSHFTYKPDGSVFVDIDALGLSSEQKARVRSFIADKKDILSAAFTQRCQDAVVSNAFADNVGSQEAYAATVKLLKKPLKDAWVGFDFENRSYIYNPGTPDEVRALEPLETAPSHGLKNTCAEQMIFTKGLRFPLAYENFLSDLTTRLKDAGVERVVMVDFASMYSRSSRENVRVNYVIQQLALLDNAFAQDRSFYQNFVHNSQLLAALDRRSERRRFAENFLLESKARTVLFTLLQQHADVSIEGVSLGMITDQIKTRLAQFTDEENDFFKESVNAKMSSEYETLRAAYESNRQFVTLQQFHAPDLVAFSRTLIDIMTKKVYNERINDLWGLFEKEQTFDSQDVHHDDETGRSYAVLPNGLRVWVTGVLEKDCKDQLILTPLVRQIRAAWYAALSNILYVVGKHSFDGRDKIREALPVLPLVALETSDGKIALVQPRFDTLDAQDMERYKKPDYSAYEIEAAERPEQWALCGSDIYLSDWSGVTQTYQGIYAYAHEWYDNRNDPYQVKPLVTTLCEAYQREKGNQQVFLHDHMMKRMHQEGDLANLIWGEMLENAHETGDIDVEQCRYPEKILRNRDGSFNQDTRVPVAIASRSQHDMMRLFLRAIATLEMIVKDPEADIAARRGNKDDFRAMISLGERIMLPYSFGMLSVDPLFESKTHIKPLLPWDYFL